MISLRDRFIYFKIFFLKGLDLKFFSVVLIVEIMLVVSFHGTSCIINERAESQ